VRLWLSLAVMCGLAVGAEHGRAPAPESRMVESIVPWLAYNPSCWSAVTVQNLGNRDVDAEVEAHKSSGALAPLAGQSGIQVHLRAGEKAEYKLQLPEETTGAWIRVREKVPAPELSPVLAVSGTTECVASDELRTTPRDVVWPVRNPWYSGDVKDDDNGVIAVINTTEKAAALWGCYSFGVLYSVPDHDRPVADLTPVCSETIREMVPPFGSRQYAVSREGNSHFSLATRGDAMVLQMLRPVGTTVKVYRVDATIKFGEEAPSK